MSIREFLLNTAAAIVIVAAIGAFWILLVVFGSGPTV
jgi:hypothetical protein